MSFIWGVFLIYFINKNKKENKNLKETRKDEAGKLCA